MIQKPTNSSIPLIEPCLSGREAEYVAECLSTGWVSSAGSYVNRFESMVADSVECEHAVATSSGTAALHLALVVAGVQPDDEVLVSDLTFVAPANAVRYVGAWPVFVDAERDYWQMDVSLVEQFLRERCRRSNGVTINERTGRRVSAVIPVHVLGHPVDMAPLVELAGRYGLAIIEDATESLGARYQGRPLGGIGVIGCLSFNGNKLLTTGGGGMLVTHDAALATHARYLSTQAKDDPIRYVHDEIGFNYRLSNVLAAMGVGQMEQLDRFLQSKRRIAARYGKHLSGMEGIETPQCPPMAESSWWLYSILVEPAGGASNMGLLQALDAEGIQTRPLWQPLHLNRPYHAAERLGGSCAERLYARALSLPSSVQLTEPDQDRVIAAISRYAAAQGRG
jgi:perosamine synthetase